MFSEPAQIVPSSRKPGSIHPLPYIFSLTNQWDNFTFTSEPGLLCKNLKHVFIYPADCGVYLESHIMIFGI
jgi:hypothetical protein